MSTHQHAPQPLHSHKGVPPPKQGTAYALVRIRGTVNVNGKVRDTMRMLRIAAPNHCVIVPANDSTFGMIKKVQDYIAFGEVDVATATELLQKRGKTTRDEPLTDEFVRTATEGKYANIAAFAQALVKGETTLTALGDDAKPLFRLAPPKGGHGTVKRHVGAGGPLGYHGKAINELVKRMI